MRQIERILRSGITFQCSLAEFDVTDSDPDRFFATLEPKPRTVVMVVGLLGLQTAAESDDALSVKIMQANYLGPVRFLLAAARAMERRGGCIIGVSSVAGDRGRRSNFVYGSAKAGFTAFLSGLRNRLIRQGPCDHDQTRFCRNQDDSRYEAPADPDSTARPGRQGSVQGPATKGRDIVYVRPIWRLIMLIIRLIPERLFKRLSI